MTSVAHLFPISTEISKQILNRSIPISPGLCQGANALTQALGAFANGRQITWGIKYGMVDGLLITTEEGYALPLITSPTRITFILAKP
jgi:hypothetical protein